MTQPGIPTASRTRALLVPAAVGALTGLASTWPWELGAAVAVPLWAVVGVLLGIRTGRRGPVLAAGAAYGVALTLVFLYSRFGGATGDLPAYSVFVLVMAVGGAFGGVVSVFAGSRLT